MQDLKTAKERIRQQTTISHFISQDVKLTRKGHNWSGLCPFHNEKSPSFVVNDERGNYHCFGCGAHGDIFQYLMEKKGMTFIDALKTLSDHTGISLPKASSYDQSHQSSNQETLREITDFCLAWFQHNLRLSHGEAAREYLLNKRGLSKETIQKFQLGFAPDRRSDLYNELKRRGYCDDMMQQSGMIIFPEDARKQPYDRFRGRVMFPIFDVRGNCIAFGGRIMGQGQPKYLNSPETPLFHKGQQLYNLDKAREARDGLLIVEGYMDVIGLAQQGIHHAVAPLGTAITSDQIRMMWRYTDTPVFCMDGDTAGRKAAFKAALLALPHLVAGKSIRTAFLPDDEDPDSFVAKDKNAFTQLLQNAQPLSSFLWQQLKANAALSTPEGKAAFKKDVKQHLLMIENLDVRKFYIDDYKTKIEELFSVKKQKLEYYRNNNSTKPLKLYEEESFIQVKKNNELKYKILLVTLLVHPYLINQVMEELSEVKFSNALWENIKILLIQHGHDTNDPLMLKKLLLEHGFARGYDDLIAAREFLPQFTNDHDEGEDQLKEERDTKLYNFWIDIWKHLTVNKNLRQEIQETITNTKRDLTAENWERVKRLKLNFGSTN